MTDLRRILAGRRWSLALAALLLGLMQSLAIAQAVEGTASGPRFDIFGNPLCITGEVDHGTSPGDHGGRADCCLLACTIGALALDIPAAPAAVQPPPLRLLGDMQTADAKFALRDIHIDLRSRAPPVRA